jgi:hypothetical protein
MTDARAHLAAGTFGEFYRDFIVGFKPSEKVLAQRRKHSAAGKCFLGSWRLEESDLKSFHK